MVLLIIFGCCIAASLMGFVVWYATKRLIAHSRNVEKLDPSLTNARVLELSLQHEHTRLSRYRLRFSQEQERLKLLPGRDELFKKYSLELTELDEQLKEIGKLAVPVLRERIVLELSDIMKPLEDGRLFLDDMTTAHFDQNQIRSATKKMVSSKSVAQAALRRLLSYRLPQSPTIVDLRDWAVVYSDLVEYRESSREYIQGVVDQIELLTDRLKFIQNRLERLESNPDEKDDLKERILEITAPGSSQAAANDSHRLAEMEMQIMDIEGTLETHRRISLLLERSKSVFPDSKT